MKPERSLLAAARSHATGNGDPLTPPSLASSSRLPTSCKNNISAMTSCPRLGHGNALAVYAQALAATSLSKTYRQAESLAPREAQRLKVIWKYPPLIRGRSGSVGTAKITGKHQERITDLLPLRRLGKAFFGPFYGDLGICARLGVQLSVPVHIIALLKIRALKGNKGAEWAGQAGENFALFRLSDISDRLNSTFGVGFSEVSRCEANVLDRSLLPQEAIM